VIVYENPVANFTFSNVCEDGTTDTGVISFTSTSAAGSNPGALTYEWDFSDGGVGTPAELAAAVNVANPTFRFEVGTHTVWLTVTQTSPNGVVCTGTISKTVTVYPNPVVTAELDFTQAVCGGYEGNMASASASGGSGGPYTYTWTFRPQDIANGWGFAVGGSPSPTATGPTVLIWASGGGDQLGNPPTGPGVVTVTVTDAQGCTTSTTLTIQPCVPENYCTYTQGFYGSGGGNGCTIDGSPKTDINMMLYAMDAGGTPTADPRGKYVEFGRSFTSGSTTYTRMFRLFREDINIIDTRYFPTTSTPVQEMLPGSMSARPIDNVPGKPYAEWDELVTWKRVVINESKGRYKNTDGRIENILLAQTMVLWFNIQQNTALNNLPINESYLVTADAWQCGTQYAIPYTTKYYIIPQAVIDYLKHPNEPAGNDFPATVGGLMQLANYGLAGFEIPGNPLQLTGQFPVALSAVAQAVDAFNRGFDECRIFVGYSATQPTQTFAGKKNKYAPEFGGTIDAVDYVDSGEPVPGMPVEGHMAYPNPFSEKTTIRFVADGGQARVEVYSVNGVRMAQLFDGETQQGEVVETEFNAGDLPQEMYIYRISTEKGVTHGKLMFRR
jgi:hypothetical protein